MSNYQLAWDDHSKIVTIRFTGFVGEAEVELLSAELLEMAALARRQAGKLRMLFDNRDGAVFSPKAAEAFGVLRSIQLPDDRCAVLVSGNLNRLQADRNKSGTTRVFMTEAEAKAWMMSES